MNNGTNEALHAYYERGGERDRLTRTSLGPLEFERTQEIIARYLPPAPAVVADIGGAAGCYAFWLADLGYEVHLRDIVALHVDQAQNEAARRGMPIDAQLGDARALDLADCSVDAALLLGPLYHLGDAADRLRALAQAHRVLRPGGVVFAAALSRWAARLMADTARAMYRSFDNLHDALPEIERTGVMAPLVRGGFTAYSHRPDELRNEIEAAGLICIDLVSVEGIGFAFDDIDERMANAQDRAVVFDAARALERVPELLGLGPHLIATARKPT